MYLEVQGFETEFVAASGSLQDQIDIIGAAGVTSVNEISGAVIIAGADTVGVSESGQTITISNIEPAIVGADGITVISGAVASYNH